MSSLLVASSVAVAGLMTGVGSLGMGAAPASGLTAKSCVSRNLRITLGTAQGTAGTIYYPIVFTNLGPFACSIFGVPAIQPVSGVHHRPVGPPARSLSMGEMPALHTLAKGQSVSVAFGVVETGNYAPSTCVAKAASGVQVSIGSFVHSRYVRLPINVCTARASTTTKLLAPVSPGTSRTFGVSQW
jgi:hypothetical protein